MFSDSPLSLLGHPEAYAAQIERLTAKYGRRRRLDGLSYRGLSLGELGMRQGELCRMLARTVARGEYTLGPVTLAPALIAGKRRLLCRSHLIDTIVLGVLAQVLAGLAESALSPRVYSYRPGRSSWETIFDIRRFFEAHRAERPDVRERGLYVLHRDIKSYGASIPTDDDSALWTELHAMLTRVGVPRDHFIWTLIRGAMRPVVQGAATPPGIGVPTGSPVQPIACNLYLASVDRLLERIPGAFYARFGDDMLFCHPDAAVARRAVQTIDRTVTALRLQIKDDKRRDYYLTGPGRRSAEWPESRATSEIDYLGFRVDLGGNVGLKAEKARRLIRELRVRIQSAARLARPSSNEERMRAVCQAIARALDPSCPISDPLSATLRYVVTDRGQLRQLDYAVALAIAEALSGRRGPRAFRDVPYRSLREHAGLPSLVTARNARGGSWNAP